LLIQAIFLPAITTLRSTELAIVQAVCSYSLYCKNLCAEWHDRCWLWFSHSHSQFIIGIRRL